MGCSVPGATYLSALALPAKRLLAQHVSETVKVTWGKSGLRFSKVTKSHRKITFKGTHSLEQDLQHVFHPNFFINDGAFTGFEVSFKDGF